MCEARAARAQRVAQEPRAGRQTTACGNARALGSVGGRRYRHWREQTPRPQRILLGIRVKNRLELGGDGRGYRHAVLDILLALLLRHLLVALVLLRLLSLARVRLLQRLDGLDGVDRLDGDLDGVQLGRDVDASHRVGVGEAVLLRRRAELLSRGHVVGGPRRRGLCGRLLGLQHIFGLLFADGHGLGDGLVRIVREDEDEEADNGDRRQQVVQQHAEDHAEQLATLHEGRRFIVNEWPLGLWVL